MFENITCPMKNERRNWFWDEKRFRKHRLAYRLQITSWLWVVCMCVCESFHQFRHRHASERGKMSFSMHQTEMTLEESIIPTYFRVTGNTQNVTLAHTHTHIASNVELWRLMKGFPFISSTQNHSSYNFGSPLVCTRAFVCMWFLCNGHGSIEIIWTMTNKSRKLITTMTVSHMRYVEFSDIIPKIRQAS